MGPIPPASQEENNNTRKPTIKWVDEKSDPAAAAKDQPLGQPKDTKGLVTNKSSEDLNLKKIEDLKPIDTHKNPAK